MKTTQDLQKTLDEMTEALEAVREAAQSLDPPITGLVLQANDGTLLLTDPVSNVSVAWWRNPRMGGDRFYDIRIAGLRCLRRAPTPIPLFREQVVKVAYFLAKCRAMAAEYDEAVQAARAEAEVAAENLRQTLPGPASLFTVSIHQAKGQVPCSLHLDVGRGPPLLGEVFMRYTLDPKTRQVLGHGLVRAYGDKVAVPQYATPQAAVDDLLDLASRLSR